MSENIRPHKVLEHPARPNLNHGARSNGQSWLFAYHAAARPASLAVPHMIRPLNREPDLAHAVTEMDQYRLELASESLADLTANIDPAARIEMSAAKLSPLLRLTSMTLNDIAHRAGNNIVSHTFSTA